MKLQKVEKLDENSYLINQDLYASVHLGDLIRMFNFVSTPNKSLSFTKFRKRYAPSCHSN